MLDQAPDGWLLRLADIYEYSDFSKTIVCFLSSSDIRSSSY